MFLKKISSGLSLLSIRLRLTLLFVMIFGTTLILYAILTFNFVATALQKEFDDALYNYAVDVSESVNLDSSGDLSVMTPKVDQQKIYPFALGTALIQIRAINGDILTQVGNFGNYHLPYKKDFQSLAKGEDSTFRTISAVDELPSKEADRYRVINFAIDNSPIPQLVLQIAVPLTFVDRQLQQRLFFYETSIPFILILAMLAGYFLSTRAMKPISRMIDAAHEISANRLSERLPEPLAHDELRLLARTLNQMLGRIEQAFTSQEKFVADASHQLLTPLAILKSEISTQLKLNAKPWLISLSQEVELLIALVQNMLMLAKVDAGLSALSFSKANFDDIVMDCLARAQKAAQGKSIQLQFNLTSDLEDSSPRPQIKVDVGLIENAVFNLIENSIKYSPENSLVTILLHCTAQTQRLSIADLGPGIAQDKIDSIFDRFSRGSTASKAVPGYGLGLAIAKKIADLHEAKIWVNSPTQLTNENHKGFGTTFFLEIKNI